MANQALRYNEGKPKYSYIDLESFADTAKVLEFGAAKYARDNWKLGLPVTSILDSTLRHISAIQRGEFLDPESGLPHHGHLGCNIMFLSYVMRHKPEHIDIEPILSAAEKYYE